MDSLYIRIRNHVRRKFNFRSSAKTSLSSASASLSTSSPTRDSASRRTASTCATSFSTHAATKEEATTSADTAHIFAVGEYDEAYWNTYLAARPKYSASFYKHIFDYHISHGLSTEIAHDVGTGPGQVAAVLAEQFSRVYASDNSRAHLDVAAHRLRTFLADKRISLVEGKAENIADEYPQSSADFIAAAECAPLLDRPAAIAAWSKVLRPGGTLAIWFYGRPAFAGDDERAVRCQAAYDRIATMVFAKVIQGLNPVQKAGWARTTVALKSWLDDIELPTGDWTNIERMKWNPDKTMSFYDDAACDFTVEPTSAVNEGEKVVEVEDRSFWAEHWDVEDIKKFLKVNLPKINEMNGEEGQELDSLYQELEQAIGAHGSRIDVTWPVVLILAQRK